MFALQRCKKAPHWPMKWTAARNDKESLQSDLKARGLGRQEENLLPALLGGAQSQDNAAQTPNLGLLRRMGNGPTRRICLTR